MQIWVDADACPAEAKEVLFRAVGRTGIPLTLVANSYMNYPQSELIAFELVKAGADVADQRIVELLVEGDIVVTADIPLAADAIAKGALVIEPRGELFDKNNIGSRLSTRNLLEEFRANGMVLKGPSPYSAKDKQNFANKLDGLLTKFFRI
jgi:uncharacterized protein YaiI (UPF0178 family)